MQAVSDTDAGGCVLIEENGHLPAEIAFQLVFQNRPEKLHPLPAGLVVVLTTFDGCIRWQRRSSEKYHSDSFGGMPWKKKDYKERGKGREVCPEVSEIGARPGARCGDRERSLKPSRRRAKTALRRNDRVATIWRSGRIALPGKK
jgi:hypothetical protein